MKLKTTACAQAKWPLRGGLSLMANESTQEFIFDMFQGEMNVSASSISNTSAALFFSFPVSSLKLVHRPCRQSGTYWTGRPPPQGALSRQSRPR
eukprot:scaffold154283_cov33-Prasinocladus_malaysianus.AAC.1